jgi:Protein phosphatase 2C
MWKIIGASVTGTGHQARGTGCEDMTGWISDLDLTCLAVADGAGSRPLARRGAITAVNCALWAARLYTGRADMPDPADWLNHAFSDVRGQIATIAEAEGRDAGDYAATLGVAILTSTVVCAGQVGDTIVVAGGDGRYRTVAPAPHAEYVNETDFVTDEGALNKLRIAVLPIEEVDAIVVSTDGLQFKILADLTSRAPFVPFFEDLVSYARSAHASNEGIREWLAQLEDQTGDDKSLIVAVRVDQAPAPAGGRSG